MPNRELLYLSRADVEAVALPMSEIIARLEVAFRDHAAGRTQLPPKIALHTRPEAFNHAMPAYLESLGATGMKWVSGYPENQAKGIPHITGLLILSDDDTGVPLTVMDCTWITAKRTGAASALSAKYLARPESSVIGILGCGTQGRSNLEALNEMFSLERLVAYDPYREGLEQFAADAISQYGLEVEIASEPQEAVSGCDIVVTAGPSPKAPHATIKAGWFDEGAFASLVDFDAYWDRPALHEADKFTTDDIGQYEYYRAKGYFVDVPPVYATLGELVTGEKPGRESETERTIACNLGVAICDIATASLIYERAQAMNIGTRLPL